MNFYELEDSLQPRVFILSCNENALVIQTTTEQAKIVLRNNIASDYYTVSTSNTDLTLQFNSNILTRFSYSNQRAIQVSDLTYLKQLEIQPSSNLAQFSSNAQFYYTDGILQLQFPSPSHTLNVTGNIVSGGTIYASNLQITGESVILNTVTSNTEQVIITNLGSGPALKVTQEGANPVAEFYDDTTLALLVADGGTIGIHTSLPLQTLDVRGSQIISGNLGIGTTDPLRTLDVRGDINFIGTLYQSNVLYKSSQWTSNIETKTLYYNDGYVGIGTTNTQNNHIYVFDNKVDTPYVNQILESSHDVYVSTEYKNTNGTLGVGKNTTSDDNGSGYIATYDNKDIAFGTNNIYRGRFTADGRFGIGTAGQPASQQILDVVGGAYISGNVGIGTTNPLATLAIGTGPYDVTSTLMFNSGDDVTNVDKLYWTFLTNGSKIGHSSGWNVNHYAGQSGVAEGTGNGNFHFFTGGTPNYNERLTILNNGSVGIGSTTPYALLEVNGNSSFYGPIITNNNEIDTGTGVIYTKQLMFNLESDQSTDQIYFTYYDNGSKIGHSNGWNVNLYAGQSGQTASSSNGNFHFFTGANPNHIERLTILNNGNIGIGSVSPAYKLDVVGNAYISGPLTVNSTITASSFSGTATQVSQNLVRGNYLTGNNYNGSDSTTWDVDATSTNTGNKVVARDASGNFSAGTITATLSGTATQVSSTLVRGAYLTGNNYNGSTGTTWAASASTAYNGGSVLVARDSTAYMYASGVGIGTDTARKLLDVQGGDAIVSGNIGIGTTALRGTLHLYKQNDAVANTLIIENKCEASGNTNYSSAIIFQESSGATIYDQFAIATQFNGATGANGLYFIGTPDTTTIPSFPNNVIMSIRQGGNVGIGTTNPRQRLDIQGGNAIVSGSVGIGTTNPLYKLHVEGTSYFNGAITTNNTNINAGTGTVTAATFSGTATQVSQNLTRGNYLTGANYNGSVATTWAVDADVAATANKVAVRDASAYLFASGVGIGTATARAPIDVIGNVLVSGNIGIGTTVAKYPIHLHSSEDVFTVNNGKVAISYGSAITPSTDLEIRNSSDTSYTGILLTNDGNNYPTASLRIEGKRYDQSAAIAYAGNMGLYRYNNNAALNSNLPLGLIHFGGNHTSGNTANRAFSAYMGAISEENFATSSNMRTAFVFASTNNAYDYFNTSLTHTDEKMRLNSYGNLGIGTTLPQKKLDVQGDINFTGSLYENNALYVSSQWTSNMSGSTLYYNGNVGIGTTIAAVKLDVRGNSYFGKGLNGVYNSFVGGPFHKQEGWDTAGTSHTITYPNYCVADNSSGTIHIQVKSATADKLGNASVSFLKANAANVDLFNIHYHKTANLNTFTITASTNDISITTDSDCAIAWSSIGSC